jgi:predicted phage-related endonuclease
MQSLPSPTEVLLSDLLLFPPATVASDADPVGQRGTSSSALNWPRLDSLQLSAERLDARSRGIGGSDANIILSGDPERVLRLWQEKRGDAEPEDLSGRLAVVLGCWTEEFNRQWYAKLSGNPVTDAGVQLTCTTYRWRKCTLDGVVAGSGAIFEAKHTNSFVKPEDVLERYMPQLQHNMAVAKADRAVLSVIFGNARYEMFEVAADWLYQLDLLEAEKAFWSAVLSGEPPVVVDAPPAPRPVATRELSFEGNNAWASAAADWLQTNQTAKTHATACKTLKNLLDDDVRRAFGHGVEARRNKAGAITIRSLG